MVHPEAVERRLAERAHELYWHSDRSVNSIADEMGLSKGRLYDLIDPFPSGTPCPTCGSELVYENRTARDRGTSVCPECGPVPAGQADASSRELGDRPKKGRAPSPGQRKRAEPAAASTDGQGTLRDFSSSTTVRIMGGVLVGAAGVLLLTRYFRR